MRKPQYQYLLTLPTDHEIIMTRFNGEDFVILYTDRGVIPNVVKAVKGSISWDKEE